MIPRLVNSFLCSFKALEKWLFWITGELNREEWFHYEIMIHDVLSFLRRVLATSNITHAQLYDLILVELWFHVLWFWTSGTKGFLQEQKTRVTRFSEEKKKQGWLAKTNDARVFPASLAWLPCFSLRSDYLFTLHFCFPLSGSKSKNFLQPVSPHCYIASCNPSLRLLPCLTNLSPEENKSAASLRNPVCVIGQSRVKKKPKEMLVQPPALNSNLSCTSGYRAAQREQCLVQEHHITL